MNYSLLSLLLCFLYGSLFAQEETKNSIGLGFGTSNFHIVDEHSTPLVFRGTGIAPSIYFISDGSKNRHFLTGSFFYDNLNSSSDNFFTENYRVTGRYSFSHNLLKKQKTGIYLGGSLSSFFCYSDYFFWVVPSYARSITSWYWSHSFDLSMHLEYRISPRNLFTFHCYIPLVSNVSRPEYSPSGGYDYTENKWIIKSTGKNEIFPENSSVNIRMFLQHNMSKRISLIADYEFYYLKYKRPGVINMYMNNLRAGTFINF